MQWWSEDCRSAALKFKHGLAEDDPCTRLNDRFPKEKCEGFGHFLGVEVSWSAQRKSVLRPVVSLTGVMLRPARMSRKG